MSPAVTLVVAIAWGVFVLWLIGPNWTRRHDGNLPEIEDPRESG